MTTSPRSRFVLPLVAAFAVVTPGCGTSRQSDPPATAVVAELSDDEVLALCEDFIGKACAAGVYPPGEPTCGACRPCDQETSVAVIRTKCGGSITVGDVQDCVDSGFDEATCTGRERGGCLFDVGDQLCD